ncbi:MAG: DUF3857 domain-containing protein [Pseudomonadota bacterium]|nr:DUF3857 domain-containing protein [Pseudomonadota bacterium]
MTSTLAFALASAAQAGDKPIYDNSPAWIETVSVKEADKQESHRLIVSDQQVRIEEGLRWDYFDKVHRIKSSDDLSRVGTQTFRWQPDKGDLIIHEISILRAGQTIDILDEGGEIEVLRRERGLKRGILDGSLTATIAVPGLKVGDKLRVRYSTTTSDQALGDDVQSWIPLWREANASRRRLALRAPSLATLREADFARARVSWPDDLDVQYKAGPNFELDEPVIRDGYRSIEVMLPLPEAETLPRDAPRRFRMQTALQLGTFADWAEVSAKMAPLYDVEGELGTLPELQDRVDAIGAQPVTDLEKAVDALKLVQEDIRYLANGLDGGNYFPQSVATTWQMKYGDCKAKTVMLLALLDQLGIEAEAVLVSTNRGNAVPVSLPIPGAFNHVLVRAIIDGEEYFLDGTGKGANIQLVDNVPPFEYYLPIQNADASLKPIRQTLPRVPDTESHLVLDASAGLDLPVIGTIRTVIRGPRAVRANADKKAFLEGIGSGRRLGPDGKTVTVASVELEETDDTSKAVFRVTGVLPPVIQFDGTRGTFNAASNKAISKFSPNRARREWRDIPVALRRASARFSSVNLKLPFEASEMKVVGKLSFEGDAGGASISRKAELDGQTIKLLEKIVWSGGELEPDAIREERRKAQRLAAETLVFETPEATQRKWRFAGKKDRSALAPIEEMMAKAIARDPEEKRPLEVRARFRQITYDFKGALEDMTSAIEIGETAHLFEQRAKVQANLRDWAAAIADLTQAYDLDPTPARAMALAKAMAHLGEQEEARAMLELESGNEGTQRSLAVAIANLDAALGEKQAGLQRIDDQLSRSPNNSWALNAKCWYIGTWQFALEDGNEACRLAVERSRKPAQALDSRAMYYLRSGELDKARADIEEAFSLAPRQDASLLLRGLIKREQGDRTAETDIKQAIARRPELIDIYSRWGFDIGE